jgi:hypothetical protein
MKSKVFFLVLVILAFASSAQNRHALVVGNSQYSVSPLANPEKDAKAIEAQLKNLGFEVELVLNGSRRDMLEGLRSLEGKLSQGDIALFYYAGHGVQVNGQNYLIPVGANIQGENEVEYESMPLNRILTGIQSKSVGTSLIFLDACRNNPYRSASRGATRGLTVVQTGGSALIAFATAPGDVALDGEGENSPFTAALLAHMSEPGVEVEQMMKKVRSTVARSTSFKQTPWSNSSLLDSFYFVPPNADAPVAVNVTPQVVQRPAGQENRPDPPGPKSLAEDPEEGMEEWEGEPQYLGDFDLHDPWTWVPEEVHEEGRPIFPDGPPAYSGYFWMWDEVVFWFDPEVYLDRDNYSPETDFGRLTEVPEEVYVAGDFNDWFQGFASWGKGNWRMEPLEYDDKLYFVLRKPVDEFKEPVAQFKFMSPSVKNNNEFLETPEIAFNRIEDRQGQLNLHLTTVIDPAGDPAHTGFFVEPGAMAFLFDAAYYLESEQLYDLPEEVFVVGDFSNWQRSEDFALEEIEEGLWIAYFDLEDFEPGMQFKFQADNNYDPDFWLEPPPFAENALVNDLDTLNLELWF